MCFKIGHFQGLLTNSLCIKFDFAKTNEPGVWICDLMCQYTESFPMNYFDYVAVQAR